MRERNGGAEVLAHRIVVPPTSGSENRNRSSSTADMVTPPGFEQTAGSGGAGGGVGDVMNPDAALAIASTQPIIAPHEAPYQDQAQFECDKRAVYKHPLFPLLALLFEKCEMATRTSNESPFSDSFHQDLEAFVQHQERDRKPFLANDPEVDGLMIKAIQVLRIHLLELDKVQELCKDFCNRYIACLKGKMQSENLLRSDYFDGGGGGGHGGGGGYAGGGGGASLSSNSNSPHHSSFSSNGDMTSISPPINMHSHHHTNSNNNNNNNNSNHSNNNNGSQFLQQSLGHHGHPPPVHDFPQGPSPQYPPSCSSPLDQNSSVGGDSTVGGGVSPPLIGVVHGSTPLSQIGANTHIPPPPHSSSSGSIGGGGMHDPFVQSQCETPPTPSSAEEDDDYLGGRKKPKRGVLPKHATSIMRSWLFQHIVHPYPTEDEKRQIAAQTNLTLLQVNNWFINARRRILQPMLDASNPETPAPPKVKKMKTNGSKSAMKFWSDNMHSSGSSVGGNGPSSGTGINMSSDETGLDDPDDSGDDSDDTENNDHDSHDPRDLLIDNSDSSQQ